MSGGTSWAIAKANDAKAQRLYAASKPHDVTPSITYGNATTTGYYTGNSMQSARPEADQHKQYTGAGFQAQIDRRTV